MSLISASSICASFPDLLLVSCSFDSVPLLSMEYERRVNERQIQTTEEKTDTSNALDASSVIIESNGTESKEQDTSSRSGNDAHVDDADIRLIYDEAPMVEVQMTFDRSRSSLELGIQDHSNEHSSSKLVPKVVPLAVKTTTSRQELGLLFHLHIAMLRTT
ncbi:hypothetical protein Tco_0166680, partial [Tanacetum coccineum]